MIAATIRELNATELESNDARQERRIKRQRERQREREISRERERPCIKTVKL